jgi:hypothetical protein
MKSRFNNSRIFNDPTGWYVIMRESDKEIILSMKFKRFGNQHIMGPFNAKHDLQNWLEGYLSVHGENRSTGYTYTDSIAT